MGGGHHHVGVRMHVHACACLCMHGNLAGGAITTGRLCGMGGAGAVVLANSGKAGVHLLR